MVPIPATHGEVLASGWRNRACPRASLPAKGKGMFGWNTCRCGLLVLLAFAAACRQAAGQAPDCAPVLLEGNEVIRICSTVAAVKPDSRAVGISERLLQIARDPAAPSIHVAASGGALALMSGDRLIAAVFEADARNAGMAKEELARRWAASLERAVRAYRDVHSTRNIIRRVLLAILLIAAVAVLLTAIRRGTRRAGTAVWAGFERRLQTADARIIELLPNDVTRNLFYRGLHLARLVMSLLVLYVALQLLLGLFPVTRALARDMLAATLRPVRAFAAAAWAAAPSLAFVALVAVFTWYLLRLIRYIFRKIGDGTLPIEGFRPAWAGTTQKLVSFFVVILAALIAYPYIPGSQSDAFKGVSIFLGVLVSLGSTGLVSNIVSGIMLTYMDAFQVGDYVAIGEEAGYVVKKSVLTTQLKTRINRIVTIPNSNVLTRQVVNLTAPDSAGIVVTSTVGIGYEAPWRQVEALLKQAAARTPGIRPLPEPFVLVRALEQFSITYEIDACLEPGVRLYLAEAELNRNILDAFNNAGIQIMTPAYEGDPEHPKVAGPAAAAKDFGFTSPAARGDGSL